MTTLHGPPAPLPVIQVYDLLGPFSRQKQELVTYAQPGPTFPSSEKVVLITLINTGFLDPVDVPCRLVRHGLPWYYDREGRFF